MAKIVQLLFSLNKGSHRDRLQAFFLAKARVVVRNKLIFKKGPRFGHKMKLYEIKIIILKTY